MTTRGALLWLAVRAATACLLAYAVYRIVVYATEPLFALPK